MLEFWTDHGVSCSHLRRHSQNIVIVPSLTTVQSDIFDAQFEPKKKKEKKKISVSY